MQYNYHTNIFFFLTTWNGCINLDPEKKNRKKKLSRLNPLKTEIEMSTLKKVSYLWFLMLHLDWHCSFIILVSLCHLNLRFIHKTPRYDSAQFNCNIKHLNTWMPEQPHNPKYYKFITLDKKSYWNRWIFEDKG